MKEVEEILNKEIRDNKTPGVNYLVFNRDKLIYNFKGGFADVENNIKINDLTTFNAYSITKTFTALAVLQLAEKNELNIKDPAIKYLPEFPYQGEITIQQLLAHTAGIPNPVPLSWIHLTEDHQTFDRNKFFEKVMSKNNHVKTHPNEKFSYSNLGYVLLGQLIEKVSGMKYEDYIRKNILLPLNIEKSELDFTINNPGDHAKGYHKNYSLSYLILGLFIDKTKYMGNTEGKWISFKNNYVNGVSYGGLIGTANAFVKYIQELLKTDCRLISKEYKSFLFTENHTNNNKPTGMCLSWYCGQLNGEKYFTHAGGGGGYYCEIRIYPGKESGSVIMFNRTGMKDERFLDKPDSCFL
ncbi:MAG TPA: serine hydrolase domain-containing protein [Ignavibacteria bacterium]|nr:serine hydrolase domain-containing protein [Ignavibacteria bacterium]